MTIRKTVPKVIAPLETESIDGFEETIYDEQGNKVQLKYHLNDKELRIESFVNDILFDYSTVEVLNGVYSETIKYHKVAEPNEATPLTNKNTINPKVTLVEEYNVNDFIKSVDTPVEAMNANRVYLFLYNKYNSVLDITGSLYRATETQEIKKFMFDYAKGAALTVISAGITTVFGLGIVAVTMLLVELGVGVVTTFTTAALNGYYDATRYDYWYKVYVNGKVTYEHAQHQVDVKYYNSNNAKQSIRSAQSLSWASENAIMNTGILAGS